MEPERPRRTSQRPTGREMSTDPDFELVRSCQRAQGQESAESFERLFHAYRDRVYNLAVRLLGDPVDAEDVSQEAFVTVFRRIGEFRFSSRFYTWLYRVVYNLCMDHKRRTRGMLQAAEGHGDDDDREDGLGGLQDPEQGPLEKIAETEFRSRAVERALRRLSRPLRAVIILRYMEELQYGEIAEALGCSVGTVKSRLSRAHHFLQQQFGSPGLFSRESE